MTQSEFREWKQHPMTQLVFMALEQRANYIKDVLCSEAGKDPTQDRYMVGYLAACNDLKQVEYADIQEAE